MDTRRKRGLEFQRWIKAWILETYPFSVVHNQQMNHIPIGPGKWACKDNDILGCIDLIVIVPVKKPIFIQATIDTHVGRKLEALQLVPWDPAHCTVQVWLKRSPTRITIKELSMNRELVNIGEIVRRKYVPR